jgi:hypothetical protein
MKENQNLTAEAADSAEETAEKIMPCYKSSRKILFVHGQITRPLVSDSCSFVQIRGQCISVVLIAFNVSQV